MTTQTERAAGRAECAAAGLVCDEIPRSISLTDGELQAIIDRAVAKALSRVTVSADRTPRPQRVDPALGHRSTAEDRRIAAAVVADVMAAHAAPGLTADERAAVDRSTRQIARMQPGQSRAPVTLETAYAVSDAIGSVTGRIHRG